MFHVEHPGRCRLLPASACDVTPPPRGYHGGITHPRRGANAAGLAILSRCSTWNIHTWNTPIVVRTFHVEHTGTTPDGGIWATVCRSCPMPRVTCPEMFHVEHRQRSIPGGVSSVLSTRTCRGSPGRLGKPLSLFHVEQPAKSACGETQEGTDPTHWQNVSRVLFDVNLQGFRSVEPSQTGTLEFTKPRI